MANRYTAQFLVIPNQVWSVISTYICTLRQHKRIRQLVKNDMDAFTTSNEWIFYNVRLSQYKTPAVIGAFVSEKTRLVFSPSSTHSTHKEHLLRTTMTTMIEQSNSYNFHCSMHIGLFLLGRGLHQINKSNLSLFDYNKLSAKSISSTCLSCGMKHEKSSYGQ